MANIKQAIVNLENAIEEAQEGSQKAIDATHKLITDPVVQSAFDEYEKAIDDIESCYKHLIAAIRDL